MEDSFARDFWRRIDSARGDLSLSDLAEKVGIKYQRMKEQRSSGRVPSADDIYRIARGLNTTMEYLYAGEEQGIASEEARLVDEDQDLRALVRAIARDRRLLHVISAVVESSERTMAGSGA